MLKNGKTRYEVFCFINRDGSGKQKKIHKRGFVKETDARRFARETESAIDEGRITENFNGNLLIKDYLSDWLKDYKVNVKEGSMVVYRYNVDHYLIPNIGDYKLNKYTYDMHQKFINTMFERGGKDGRSLSYNTVNIINATIDNAYNKAIQLGFINNNPTKNVEFPVKYRTTSTLHFWSVDQLNLFFKFAKEDPEPVWYVFFLTIVDLGIRKGEAMALMYDDIDLKNETVSINKTRLYRKETGDLNQSIVLDDPKTKASVRTLHMTQRLKSALINQIKIFEPAHKIISLNKNEDISESDFIFRYSTNPHYKNKVLRSRSTNGAFNRIIRKAGLPRIKIHDLRHTHAMLMREAGAPLEDVQDTLGHANIKSTQIYAQKTDKIVKRASDQYEQYVDGQNKKSI